MTPRQSYPYVEADYVELPDATVTQRNFTQRAELWHGLQLRSLADEMHLEMRDDRPDAARDPETGETPTLASASVPVTAFLEEAFMRSDGRGFQRDFNLDGPEGVAGGVNIGMVRLCIKFHLQADVLRALATGVGLGVASAATMAAYGEEVQAAASLAAAKMGFVPIDEKEAASTDGKRCHTHLLRHQGQLGERDSLDKAARQHATAAPAQPSPASYSSMTSGIKRFLCGQKGKKKTNDDDGNLVSLLSGV